MIERTIGSIGNQASSASSLNYTRLIIAGVIMTSFVRGLRLIHGRDIQ